MIHTDAEIVVLGSLGSGMEKLHQAQSAGCLLCIAEWSLYTGEWEEGIFLHS